MSGAPHCRPATRVLALVSDGFGAGGGIAAYNRELLGALADRLGSGSLRVLFRHGNAAAAGALQAEGPWPSPARYALAGVRRALLEPFDWVFCGHLHHLPLARIAAALGGARLWLQLHGIEAWERPASPLRRALGRVHLVTAVSRFTRRRFLEWAPLHPSRVRVLPNTVRPEFTPGPADPDLRRRLTPDGGPLLLTVSRLSSGERYKGHEQVLQALALLSRDAAGHRQAPPVYVIAGDGDDRPRLESRATALGVAGQVRFLGAVPDAQLVALYRSADAFAMPSTGEGFGIVFLEAAACGLPLVAGDADGARDALRDGLLGELVDASDPAAVAAGIQRALARGRGTSPDLGVFSRTTFGAHLARLLAGNEAVQEGERWL